MELLRLVREKLRSRLWPKPKGRFKCKDCGLICAGKDLDKYPGLEGWRCSFFLCKGKVERIEE